MLDGNDDDGEIRIRILDFHSIFPHFTQTLENVDEWGSLKKDP